MRECALDHAETKRSPSSYITTETCENWPTTPRNTAMIVKTALNGPCDFDSKKKVTVY
jgi:hypothetical protein